MSIQITVPIYNALEATSHCLQALRTHNANDQVVLINDASTDHRIDGLLTDLPGKWQVIQQTQNAGFVKTANRGLSMSEGHSILLNADAVVTHGWLDCFERVIKQVENLGTATPWSNNAEICSLPKNLTSNPIPNNPDTVAKALTQHQPEYPEIPTAVGFCMLITAEAKAQVGYFDEDTFGLGYGEENDYSLRVKQQGLRNVLVDDCYVVHWGNQSFGEKGLKPDEQTMSRLLGKHPDYLQTIQKFIEKDPLSQLRTTIIDKISTF